MTSINITSKQLFDFIRFKLFNLKISNYESYKDIYFIEIYLYGELYTLNLEQRKKAIYKPYDTIYNIPYFIYKTSDLTTNNEIRLRVNRLIPNHTIIISFTIDEIQKISQK